MIIPLLIQERCTFWDTPILAQSFPGELDAPTFRLDWTNALGALNGAYDPLAMWMLQQLLGRAASLAAPPLARALAALQRLGLDDDVGGRTSAPPDTAAAAAAPEAVMLRPPSGTEALGREMVVQQLLAVFVASADVVSVPVLLWMLPILDELLLGEAAALVPVRLLTKVACELCADPGAAARANH